MMRIFLLLYIVLIGGVALASPSDTPCLDSQEKEKSSPVAKRGRVESDFDTLTDKELGDRMALIGYQYSNSDFWRNPPKPICDVDEGWKELCEIGKIIKKRNILDFISAFSSFVCLYFYNIHPLAQGVCMLTGEDELSDCIPIPKEAVFFHFKHIAWIDPNNAEQLAYYLKKGFKDMIPVNPEWAQYWEDRANYLRTLSSENQYEVSPNVCRIDIERPLEES